MNHQRKKQKWMALILCAAMLSAALLPVKAKAAEITEPSAGIPMAQSEPPDTSAGSTIPDKSHEEFDVDAVIDAGEADSVDRPSTPDEDAIPHPAAGDSSETEAGPGQSQAEVSYQNDGGEWMEGTFIEAVQAITGVGAIKLQQDITLNSGNYSTAALTLSGSQDITLLGEGHTITSQNGTLSVTDNAVLRLGQEGYGGTLTIQTENDSGYKTSMIQVADQAALQMYDGVNLGPTTRSYAIKLEQAGTFTMYGGRIAECTTGSTPIAVTDVSRFYLEDGVIEACLGGQGGAVSLIPNNKSGWEGRALFRVSRGSIRNCESAHNGGGAIYVDARTAAELDIRGGQIEDCAATRRGTDYGYGFGCGGGIFIRLRTEASTVSLSNLTIQRCSAFRGGGIYVSSYTDSGFGSATFGEDLVIEKCMADDQGGGIYIGVSSGSVEFVGSVTVRENHSKMQGGGIYWYRPAQDLSRCMIGNNTADTAGDDLYITYPESASVTLPDNFGSLSLTNCGHKIDGWYPDGYENRWSCCGDGE